MGWNLPFPEVFAKGGEGGIALAEKVVAACEKENHFHFLYDTNLPIKEKIESIAKNIYGADGVNYTAQAGKTSKKLRAWVLPAFRSA